MKPTARLMLRNAVFSFYKHNRRSIRSNKQQATLRMKPRESKKRKPTTEDLTVLESVSHSARDKALIWFFGSTSVRVGTLVLLKWARFETYRKPKRAFCY